MKSESFEYTIQRLEDLKKSNETTAVFGFEAEDCEYLIITSDKNIKLPKHFLQYVCDDLSSFTKEIDLSEVPGDVVISIFSLHLPRTEISRGKKINRVGGSIAATPAFAAVLFSCQD